MKQAIQITGVGRTKSAEKWDLGLLDLSVMACGEALDQTKQLPTAIVTANALGGALGDQRNLAVHVAAQLGLQNVEALSISCDEASGGAAIRQAVAMIDAGMHERILVVGAEKTSDAIPDELESIRSTGLNASQEAAFGFSPTIAAALGMGRYLEVHGLDRDLFFHLAQVAHEHGAKNKMGIFSWPLSIEQYKKSPVVATPLTVCDNAPPCDGAAAIVLERGDGDGVRILASSSTTVEQGISEPIMNLTLPAAAATASSALADAGIRLEDVSLFELHDSSAFLAALSIEAVGLAKRGEALPMAAAGTFLATGPAPLWLFGGHKSRGHVPGAGGVYQVVEAVLSLTGKGEVKLDNPTVALVQCLGSFGAHAVTHILGVK